MGSHSYAHIIAPLCISPISLHHLIAKWEMGDMGGVRGDNVHNGIEDVKRMQ